jgi:hypothetical protein
MIKAQSKVVFIKTKSIEKKVSHHDYGGAIGNTDVPKAHIDNKVDRLQIWRMKTKRLLK